MAAASAQRMVVQVAPEGQGGVRDHMDGLNDAWSRAGVACAALALSREAARERPLHRRVADLLAERSIPDAGGCVILLHFSGYGYARRGLCGWLVDELVAARAALGPRLRIAVMFHELFASGPPWRSAFWLSPWQAHIAARLARLADVLWTNSEHHARWIRRVTGGARPVHVRPVFSTVGEPADPPPLAERRPWVVVFGSLSTRRRAFDALRGREGQLRRLGVEELVEVGYGGSAGPIGLSCRHVGALPPAALTRLLRNARFGLIEYPSIHLGKSGVFAAYAAHGCVAINAAADGPPADGLVCGHHYVALGAWPLPTALERTAQAACAWYAGHGLPRQAGEMLGAFDGAFDGAFGR